MKVVFPTSTPIQRSVMMMRRSEMETMEPKTLIYTMKTEVVAAINKERKQRRGMIERVSSKDGTTAREVEILKRNTQRIVKDMKCEYREKIKKLEQRVELLENMITRK